MVRKFSETEVLIWKFSQTVKLCKLFLVKSSPKSDILGTKVLRYGVISYKISPVGILRQSSTMASSPIKFLL